MLMRQIVFILIAVFCFVLPQKSFSQSPLKVDGVTSLAVDKQGNLYVVTGNGIAKYNAKFELQARYTTTFGRIESIDVYDPFKIAVFCKTFLRVFLLDNKLSLLGNPVFLPDVNILKPSVLCRSAENGIWVVDGYRQQLLYLDFTLNTTREAATMATYTSNGAYLPNFAVERGGKLLINFAGNSVAMFDKFGALLHLFSIKVDKWFDLQGTTLYYLSGKNLYAQSIVNFNEEPHLVAANVDYCAVLDNAVYTYQSGVIAKILAE